MIDKFSLWLEEMESDIVALVRAMLLGQGRYQATPRLVGADWLDDHDESELAALVRLGEEICNKPGDDVLGKRMQHYNMRAAVRSQLTDQFITIGAEHERVFWYRHDFDTANHQPIETRYQITPRGLFKWNSKRVNVQVDPGKCPYPVLKAVVFVLACAMADSPSHGPESDRDFSRHWGDFIVQSNRMIRGDQLSPTGMKRALDAMDNMVHAMRGGANVGHEWGEQVLDYLRQFHRQLFTRRTQDQRITEAHLKRIRKAMREVQDLRQADPNGYTINIPGT